MNERVRLALEAGRAVSIPDLADAAGVSRATLYRAAGRGDFDVIRIGTRQTVPPHVARRLLHLPEGSPSAEPQAA